VYYGGSGYRLINSGVYCQGCFSWNHPGKSELPPLEVMITSRHLIYMDMLQVTQDHYPDLHNLHGSKSSLHYFKNAFHIN
jgi:hypothetical protein